jgi:predicted alpha/beta-fold hydrolase
MTLHAADYRPPWWLRNGHLQTMLGSSPWRRHRGATALAATGATSEQHVVDGGAGVRLQGVYSAVPGIEPRGLALLLHGWEGSADSSYMRLTAAQFLQRGYATFRLNFRDHGDSHHLNPALFHSNRIDEVVLAACDVARRFWPRPSPARPLVAAGYSLGGNFALRLALRAPAASLSLAGVAAVCPVLDPAAALAQMERGWQLYLHHFERKWRRSLERKRALFPRMHDYDDRTLRLGMRELTQWLVARHTEFGSLQDYFDGYSIAGERLAGLQVPARILMAADDPVIPVADFSALRLPADARLEIAAQGGHCGFLQGAGMDGFAEAWVADQLTS